MAADSKIAAVDDVPESGSYLFTARDAFTNERELILVRCDAAPGVEAWVNTCTHEQQRLDRGDGVAMRDGEIVCPRHGSMFDACDGECGNGPAAGSRLTGVDVDVADGDVYLTDDNYTYLREGGLADDDPGSTSHLSF